MLNASILTGLLLLAPATTPPLSTPAPLLHAALECPAAFQHPNTPVVLLVHGTSSASWENWGWNYLRALPREGFDVCSIQLPSRGLQDIQASSEYVVHAIRTLHARTGRRVSILGHSQGGLEPRWALKFWPDTHAMVEDVIMLGTPNHGAVVASLFAPWPAANPAALQMRRNSAFLEALNAGDETPGPVSYTSIFSSTDELVQPATPTESVTPTAALNGGANLRIQDHCPYRYVSHVGLAADAVAYAAVMDALQHDGGVDVARLPADICNRHMQPHVDLLFAVDAPVVRRGLRAVNFAPLAFVEPDLQPYARRIPLVTVVDPQRGTNSSVIK